MSAFSFKASAATALVMAFGVAAVGDLSLHEVKMGVYKVHHVEGGEYSKTIKAFSENGTYSGFKTYANTIEPGKCFKPTVTGYYTKQAFPLPMLSTDGPKYTMTKMEMVSCPD